jgi:hypothetical protein
MIKRIVYSAFLVFAIFLFERISGHQIDKCVNRLFLIQVNGHFDRTVLGELSLKVNGSRIYTAKYFVNDQPGSYVIKRLTDLVDVPSWKEVESDKLNVRVFEDVNYTYRLYMMEDISMNVTPKKTE